MRENYWTTRISRRRLVQGAAVSSAGGLVILAGACGSDDTATPGGTASPAAGTAAPQSSATAAPKRGGSLSSSENVDPNSLDIHQDPNVFPQLGSIYSKILRQVKGGLAPDLAVSIPETPDERTIVVKVRQGVRFHDIAPVNGRELTAEDVKYSLDRINTDDPKFQSRRFISQIERIEATDANTLRLSLATPFAPLVTYLAFPTMVVVAREAVEVNGDLRRGPLIGTGPFQSAEIQAGVRYVNKRFENYFEQGKPYLDDFTLRIIPERGTAIAQFRSGDLSYISAATPDELSQAKSSVPKLGSEKGLRTRLRSAMNTQTGLFKDPRVRKAVHLATDRAEMITLMSGGEGEAYSVLPSFFPGVLKEADLAGKPGFRKDKAEDIAEAKRLLEAAGHANGLDVPSYLSLQLNTVPDAVTIHAQQLARAGIRATIKPIAYADWTDRMLKHDFEIAGGVTSMRLDPDDHFYTEYHSKGPRNDGHLQDADIDALIEKQRAIFDEQERQKIWRELEEKMLDALPFVPFFNAATYVTWQPGIEGLTADGGRMSYMGHTFSDVSMG